MREERPKTKDQRPKTETWTLNSKGKTVKNKIRAYFINRPHMSFPRKRESNLLWIPAFAGMTKMKDGIYEMGTHIFIRSFKYFFDFSSFSLLPSFFFGRRSLVCGLLSAVFLVSPVISRAEPQVVLPSGVYQKGVYQIAPVEVPHEARSVIVWALRNGWTDTGGDVISVRMEISNDGGRTWDFLCGFKTSGGEIMDRKTGQITDKSLLQFILPASDSSGRMVRGSVEMFTSLETEVSVDLK